MNNYSKLTLKNLSQGARLKYVRKLRYISKDDVADYFGFGGKDPHKILIVMKPTIGDQVKKD